MTASFHAACAETPGCGNANTVANRPTERLWRFRVSRAPDGKYAIERLASAEVVAEAGIPVGAVYGYQALVGLDRHGRVVDSQPIRFPSELRIESVIDIKRIALDRRRVDTVAYLKASPEIATLAVRHRNGQELHETPLPAVSATTRLSPATILGISEARAASRPFDGLPPYCSHVIVLRGEQDRHLAAGIEFEDEVTLATPGPFQLAATRAALSRMTPLLCQSIARIAFGYVPDRDGLLGAVRSQSAGDAILLNVSSTLSEASLEKMVSRRLMLQATILHEAGHAAETLLTFESSASGNYAGAWSFPARTLADQTVGKVRLEMGLPEEWQRLHESFVDQGWAAAYGTVAVDNEDEAAVPTPGSVVAAGFISRGASKNWAEDIADTIGHVYMSRAITDAYREQGVADALRQDLGCLVMRPYQKENLPSRFAALYSKLRFLEDLGLLRDEDVADCTGGRLGIPVGTTGFHFELRQGTTQRRSFQNAVAARLGTESGGAKVFEMEAAGSAGFGGETHPAKVQLQLDLGGRFREFDKVSWPRGVYELGLLGASHFRLRLDGAAAGDFDAMDGFVLVADSSSERIAGSIVVQRVFRLHAPLPVPELYDPPLVVRFLIEK